MKNPLALLLYLFISSLVGPLFIVIIKIIATGTIQPPTDQKDTAPYVVGLLLSAVITFFLGAALHDHYNKN